MFAEHLCGGGERGSAQAPSHRHLRLERVERVTRRGGHCPREGPRGEPFRHGQVGSFAASNPGSVAGSNPGSSFAGSNPGSFTVRPLAVRPPAKGSKASESVLGVMEDGELERVGGEHLERRDGVSTPQPEDALLPQHSPAHAPHAPRRSGSRERGVPRRVLRDGPRAVERRDGGSRRHAGGAAGDETRGDARATPIAFATDGRGGDEPIPRRVLPRRCAPGVTTPPTDETPPARRFRRLIHIRRGAPPSRARRREWRWRRRRRARR